MPPTARRASAKGATPPAPASTSSEPPSPSPSASSSRAREEALSTLLAFAVVALGAALLLGLRRLGFASDDMLPPPSPSKPYADFETFYAQRYLPEHSRGGTRALHAAGTLAALALLAAEPALASAMGFAVLCGLAAFEYLRFLSHGLIEFAIVLGAYVAAGAALTGSWRRAASSPGRAGPAPGAGACGDFGARPGLLEARWEGGTLSFDRKRPSTRDPWRREPQLVVKPSIATLVIRIRKRCAHSGRGDKEESVTPTINR